MGMGDPGGSAALTPVAQSRVTADRPHPEARAEPVGGGGKVGASPVTEGSLLVIAPREAARGEHGGKAEHQPLLFMGEAQVFEGNNVSNYIIRTLL